MKFKQLLGRAVPPALALLIAVSVAPAATPPGTGAPGAAKSGASKAPPPDYVAAATAAAKPSLIPKVPAGVPVATVGNRTITSVDIQRAGESLAGDPLRKKNPQAWKQALLNICVDRELLAMEAERRVGNDPGVQKRWADREYAILFASMYEKVLVPGITPTPQLLDSMRTSGLYRGVDLNYILIRDNPQGQNKAAAQRILDRLRAGARFDSLARIYSGHPPSASAGGHFGWVLARDLDPNSYADVKKAKPGDILGLYSGPYGHEIYGIAAFQELTPESLYNLAVFERGRAVYHSYDMEVLAKYHFTLDSTQVSAAIFATSLETPDSILASLRPDGTRGKVGIRPALGVLARCDVDSVTIADVIRSAPYAMGAQDQLVIHDAADLAELCGRAVLHRLVILDAKSRGIDKDPTVARELRLAREQIVTQAMVTQSRGAPPDTAALRAFYEKHADRYRLPAATTAAAAVFSNPDSAAAALAAWTGKALNDSVFGERGLAPQPGATAMTLYPGRYGTITVYADAADSLGLAVDRLAAGGRTGVVRTIQGFAVADVRSKQPARQRTLEEARGEVTRDWWTQADDDWIAGQLSKLRAATKAQVIPGRLDAVKLAAAPTHTGGTR